MAYTPGDLTPEQETALAGLPIQIRLGAYENPSDHSTKSLAAFDEVLLDGPATAPAAPLMATITPVCPPLRAASRSSSMRRRIPASPEHPLSVIPDRIFVRVEVTQN